MTLKIETIRTGALSVNSVVVYDNDTLKCTVIDIGDFNPIDKFVTEKNLTPEYVIATHGHFDHLAGVSDFCKKYQCPFAMSSDDRYFISPENFEVIKKRAEDLGYTKYNPPVNIDIDLKDMSSINGMDIIGVPGHSNGSVCIYLNKLNTLIAGDTLFYETIGRTDLVGGNLNLLLSGIAEKLLSLPDDTTIIPGHGYFTSVKHEKEFNPFLNKKLTTLK